MSSSREGRRSSTGTIAEEESGVGGMGPAWTEAEVGRFFDAYHAHGKEWKTVADAVKRGRTAKNCEAIYQRYSSFLSIPKYLQSKEALTCMIGTDGHLAQQEVKQQPQRPEKENAREKEKGGEREGATPSSPDQAPPSSQSPTEPRGGRHGSQGPAHAPQPTTRGRRTTGRRPMPTEKVKAQMEAKAGYGSPASAPAALRGASQRRQSTGGGGGGGGAGGARKAATDGPQGGRGSKVATEDLKGSRKRLFTIQEDDAQSSGAAPKKKAKGAAKKAPGNKGQQRSSKAQQLEYGFNGDDDDEDDAEGTDLLMGLAIIASDAPEALGSGDEDEEMGERRDEEAEEGYAAEDGSHHKASASGRRLSGEGVFGGASGKRSRGGAPSRKKGTPSKLPPRPPPSPAAQPKAAEASSAEGEARGGSRAQDLPPRPPGKLPLDPMAVKAAAVRRKRKPGFERPPLGLSPMKHALGRRCFNSGAISIVAAAMGPYGRAADVAREPAEASPKALAERRLRLALASPRLRRWVTAEWFYSSIDRPWFMRNEMTEFMEHIGLPGTQHRLTRAEWACLRSALGKPRRLSLNFLRQQRASLEDYRQAVRSRYEQLLGSEVSTISDMPRPIAVGQRVFAIHPATRMLHDGTVLTVEDNSARVQFDQQQLGVELVEDINLAAADPLENLPMVLAEKYQQYAVQPPVGAGAVHNNMFCVGSQMPAPPGPAKVKAAPDAEQALPPPSLDTPKDETDMLLSKVTSNLRTKWKLALQLKNPSLVLNSEEDIDAIRRSYTHLLLHLSQINAELQPSLARLQAITTSDVTTPFQEQETVINEELHRLGVNHPASTSATAAETAVAGIMGQNFPGSADGGKPPAESRQQVMVRAARMLQETLQGELQGKLSKDLLSILDQSTHPEGKWLSLLLNGCLGLLMQVQSISEAPVVARTAIDHALDPAAAALMPRCEGNLDLFKQIQAQIAALKEQLSTSA